MDYSKKIRLQKVIADAGIASRRKAEVLITEGKVKVNGEVVTELGTRVSSNDIVMVNNQIVDNKEEHVYYLLNKPRGYLSTVSDEHDRPTVIQLINDNRRIYPVGRLDMDTTGALILSNDGNFTQILTHPKYDTEKKYRVSVRGKMSFDVTNALESGLTVDGVHYQGMKVEKFRYIDDKDRSVFNLTLYEGKNRQIRKLMEHFNHPVIRLHRFQIGPLVLENMPLGSYRKLTHHEVKELLQYAKGEK